MVLSVQGEDVIMAGSFSRVPRGNLRQTWVRLDAAHCGFAKSGLKKTSVLKAEKIAVIHESVLQRKLGTLSADLMVQADEALKTALHLT